VDILVDLKISIKSLHLIIFSIIYIGAYMGGYWISTQDLSCRRVERNRSAEVVKWVWSTHP